jgi:hypothetical protein
VLRNSAKLGGENSGSDMMLRWSVVYFLSFKQAVAAPAIRFLQSLGVLRRFTLRT